MSDKLDLKNSMSGQKPKPERAGSLKTIFFAVIAVVILACAGFWLTRSPAEKGDLREQAASYIGSFLDGTPLASVADIFRPAPPPLPPEITHPATTPGTLSGQTVTSTIAAPMDFGPDLQASQIIQLRQTNEAVPSEPANAEAPVFMGLSFASETQQKVVFDQTPVGQVTEDARIRPGYLAKLANWLVDRYKPDQQGGTLNTNIQALNQECGVRLASEAQGGRSGLLRYAFHPAMISGLYKLYIDRFMQDLDAAATHKGLSRGQNKQFHRAIAGRAALLASGLAGVLRVPDLAAKLAHIDNLGQKAVDANADLTTAVFELDQLREGKSSRQEQAAAQMRIDGATARYRRMTDDYKQAQDTLAAEIRRYSGQNIDEESLLFMAAWVGRRYAQGGQARGAIESCITALRDLSGRCARYGEES